MKCDNLECQEYFCTYGCLREHELMVRNLVYHIMRDPNEIDDIVQDVFLKTYQSMDSFRGGSFRAYLCRIARNQCYDVLRKKRLRQGRADLELVVDTVASTDLGPEEIAVSKDLLAEVQNILAGFDRIDQEILLLRHVNQFSYEEIAAVVGMKSGAIRTRISRARQRVVDEVERRERNAAPELG